MEGIGANESNNYQIRLLPKFEITYKALLKKHYRKDRKGAEEFKQLVEDLIEELKINPCSDLIADLLAFPSNTAEQGFEFRKKRWRRLPKLKGAARFGRLIYLVCLPKKIVYLIWIYTHAEYQDPYPQPPAKDLAVEVNSAMQESLSEPDIEPTIPPETDIKTENSN